MTLRKSLMTVAASLVTAASTAAAASAGGEPTNQWPFTRPVGDRTTRPAVAPAQHDPAIQGEPKNGPPFDRGATIVLSSAASGFDWTDGGIGAAAGIGIALAAAGAALVVRKPVRSA